MLLAGWEVRMGKNCDRGLENAAQARGGGYYVITVGRFTPRDVK